MKKIKVLNLYACLGGNRYKWPEDEIEVTAIELDPELCRLYKERFPNDTVLQTDAHQYLLENYNKFDFIWASPPCPSHSRARYWGSKGGTTAPIYPDMKLYQEIIFLQNFPAKEVKWIIENVKPYYKPLIEPTAKIGRHFYWANFKIPAIKNIRKIQISAVKNEVQALSDFHDFDFYQYKGNQRKDKIARNLVDYEVGLAIFNSARGIIKQADVKQSSLF